MQHLVLFSYNKFILCIFVGNLYQSRQDFLNDLQQIAINSLQYNGADSPFTLKATELMTIANDFLALFNDQLSLFELNIEKSKSNIFEEFDGFDQSAENSDEDDDDMEVVEAPVSCRHYIKTLLLLLIYKYTFI